MTLSNKNEREIRRKLKELADFVRKNNFPPIEAREVNDARALGIALSKGFSDIENTASVAYWAFKEFDDREDPKAEKASSDLAEYFDTNYKTIIACGHRTIPKVKGLMVEVLKGDYDGIDCTLGGVTATKRRLLLIGEGVPEVFEPMDSDEIVVLQKKEIGNKEPYIFAKPFNFGEDHSMFGGNFIYTSDSRFPNRYPIPVHDRQEDLNE